MRRKIISYNPELKALAKKLRKEMTICEALLWKELKQKQLMGFDFDRQRPIDKYIVDFYCKDLMLAIEVDGATHYTEQGVERDAIRQSKLESLGVSFLRFDDDDIKTNINGVLDIIREWINSHPELVGRVDGNNNPPPNPSKEGTNPPPGPSQAESNPPPAPPRRGENKLFHFKQFSVRHDRSGMKVGTDGVLLGAWTRVTNAKHILDIGTGTGVIALMLAQRTYDATFDCVEIDKEAYDDATENIASSSWTDRIRVHHNSIQAFNSPTKFDLIVSNPPYFQNSFKPPDAKRGVARHTQQLTFTELLNIAKKFLAPSGKLSLILPYTEGKEFITLASNDSFYCSRKWSFRTRAEKPIERWLLEFSRIKEAQEEGEILLYENGDEWSDGYKSLTRDFYLKL